MDLTPRAAARAAFLGFSRVMDALAAVDIVGRDAEAILGALQRGTPSWRMIVRLNAAFQLAPEFAGFWFVAAPQAWARLAHEIPTSALMPRDEAEKEEEVEDEQ